LEGRVYTDSGLGDGDAPAPGTDSKFRLKFCSRANS
jgi:hypothetical protein